MNQKLNNKKFLIAVVPELSEKLHSLALSQNISRNALINYLIIQFLESDATLQKEFTSRSFKRYRSQLHRQAFRKTPLLDIGVSTETKQVKVPQPAHNRKGLISHVQA